MVEYDIIVIGSGSGALVANEAASLGMKTALIDRGPAGGTCLNRGCIPSKLLIYPADRIMEIREAERLGIQAHIQDIDFSFIMRRMRESVARDREQIHNALVHSADLQYYEGETHFVRSYTLEINGEELTAETIIIATGSRPLIPPVPGLDTVPFLTNESILELREPPASLLVIGGGYVAVEFSHFFAAIGVDVTILEMADRLVTVEDEELSRLLKQELGERMEIYTGIQAKEVKAGNGGVQVVGVDRKTGEGKPFSADALLMAVGRQSNADTLNLGEAGIEVDSRNYIKVDQFLETSSKGVYAIGDANGQQMFTHVANREAETVVANLLYGQVRRMDYAVIPHAVYTHPQIASVGLTEQQARQQYDVVVGRTLYSAVAKGESMGEKTAFAKAVLEKDTGRILGFHIIGPHAPMLIQEVTMAMTSDGHSDEIHRGIHIHPSLSELIPVTLNSAE